MPRGVFVIGRRGAAAIGLLVLLTLLVGADASSRPAPGPGPTQYVIQVSADGLGSVWLDPLLKAHEVPNFERLIREGASTMNARTDYDMTITLPNHTCMVTGRPVKDRTIGDHAAGGHGWTINTDEQPENLHANRKAYIASTFDVAHDHGLRTGLFATKTKFKLYENSYGGPNGSPDTVGEDNGRDKIDVYLIAEADSPTLVAALIATMKTEPLQYAFVHFHDPDGAGHKHNWGSPEYIAAVKKVDGYLGQLFELVENDPRLKGHTTIILSADHGGFGNNHQDNTNPMDYTIPFFVWGAQVKQGDLYAENPQTRKDPGTARPDYGEQPQPVRNGDGGNLALSLLGLPAIPDSLIDAGEDLKFEPAVAK
jgi:predicted AlkP superfamily pyrophosphatase or phosphodiesterase